MSDNSEIDLPKKKWAVVDDEEVVLEVLVAMLQSFAPCEVVPYTNPVVALDAIRSGPQDFEMLITDRLMPEMGGVDLVLLAREVAPHLRFMLVTGNTLNLGAELDRFNLPHSFVKKPFDVDKLKCGITSAGYIEVRQSQLNDNNPDAKTRTGKPTWEQAKILGVSGRGPQPVDVH